MFSWHCRELPHAALSAVLQFCRMVCNPRMAAGESCFFMEVQSQVGKTGGANSFPQNSSVPSMQPCSLLWAADNSGGGLLVLKTLPERLPLPDSSLGTFRGIELCVHFCFGRLHFPRSISSYIPLALTEMMRNG